MPRQTPSSLAKHRREAAKRLKRATKLERKHSRHSDDSYQRELADFRRQDTP
jgi:hypothetical protein